MSFRKNTHYLYPIAFGLMLGIGVWYFQEAIAQIIKNDSIKGILFTYTITLFGFILTSYGIFFSILPNLKPSLKRSETLLEVNFYFYRCLGAILLQVISSVIYLFTDYYSIFIFNAFLFGATIVMFWYIVRGIKALFEITRND